MHVCVAGLRGIPHVIGGIEAHCQKLYPEIHRQAPDVSITVLIRHGYTEAKVFRYEGLTVKTIWSPKIWGVDALIHSFLSVLYAGLFLRPDILHLHGIGPGFFAPLARILGIRTIVTHHAQDYLRPKWARRGRTFLRCGERLAASSANAVVCVSVALYNDFTDLHPAAKRRTCVIRNASTIDDMGKPNASDILEELGIEAGNYVLAVGRLEATKAFDELVTAFQLSASKGRKLVIVGSDIGDEDYARSLRRSACTSIVFAGFRRGDALRRLYEQAELFVHPSRMEGYGLVVAEALAAAVPVVLSDIPPHREFGLPAQCYFPPGDIEALAEMLRRKSYRCFLAPKASRVQRQNSWRRTALRHLQLYASVVGRDSPQAVPDAEHTPPADPAGRHYQLVFAAAENKAQ